MTLMIPSLKDTIQIIISLCSQFTMIIAIDFLPNVPHFLANVMFTSQLLLPLTLKHEYSLYYCFFSNSLQCLEISVPIIISFLSLMSPCLLNVYVLPWFVICCYCSLHLIWHTNESTKGTPKRYTKKHKIGKGWKMSIKLMVEQYNIFEIPLRWQKKQTKGKV